MKRTLAAAVGSLTILAGACTSGLNPDDFEECVWENRHHFIASDFNEDDAAEFLEDECPPNSETRDLLDDENWLAYFEGRLIARTLFGG